MAIIQRCLGSLRAFRFVSLRCLATTTQSPFAAQKKLLTPYMMFVSDKQGDLTRANPGIRIPDLGRMLGQMWRSLPEQTKEEYRMRYHDDKEIFDAKKKSEMDSLTEAERLQLKEDAKAKKNKKQALKNKRLKRALGKPKATDVNPFILYIKSKSLERGDAPISQYVKGLSEHWKRMPEDDKQPFVEKARANSLLYRQKISEWERKMLSQGHTDLLSQTAFKRMTHKRTVKTPRTKKPAARGTVTKKSTPKMTAGGKASQDTNVSGKKKPIPMLPKKEAENIAGKPSASIKEVKDKSGGRNEGKVKSTGSVAKKRDDTDSD